MPSKTQKRTPPNNHTTKYANQYKLAIIKDDVPDGEPFVFTRKSTGYAALGELTPAEFKVWYYLSAQAPTGERCTWDLSPRDIANVTSLSINGVHDCLKALEAKHFITRVANKPRSKAFFEKQTTMPVFTEAWWE